MIGHMKDRGSLIQLLDTFGFEPTEELPKQGHYLIKEYAVGSSVFIVSDFDDDDEHICEFEFDINGNFLTIGVWHRCGHE